MKTHMARYSVCTPYPGTQYFRELEDKDKIIEKDYTRYNQQTLVFDHQSLSKKDLKKLIDLAYRKYYIRPRIILNILNNLIT